MGTPRDRPGTLDSQHSEEMGNPGANRLPVTLLPLQLQRCLEQLGTQMGDPGVDRLPVVLPRLTHSNVLNN